VLQQRHNAQLACKQMAASVQKPVNCCNMTAESACFCRKQYLHVPD
jgi:hypothetical protein